MTAAKKKKPPVKKAPAKRGRPSLYSDALATKLCDHIATGKSLVSFCQKEGNPGYSTVTRWLDEREDFRASYARARALQADYLAEQIVEIADDSAGDVIIDKETGVARMNGEFAARSRLKVDARKWYAAQLAPKKYGDKLQVDQTTRYENLPDDAIAARMAAIQKQMADAAPSTGEAQHEEGA